MPAIAVGPGRLHTAVGEQHGQHGRPQLGPVEHRQVARQVLVLRPRGEESQQGSRGRTSVHGVPVTAGHSRSVSGCAGECYPVSEDGGADLRDKWGLGEVDGERIAAGAGKGELQDGTDSGQQGATEQQQV